MSTYKHPYITYLGKQETHIKDEFYKLYNCIACRNTIVYEEKSGSIIVAASTRQHAVQSM